MNFLKAALFAILFVVLSLAAIDFVTATTYTNTFGQTYTLTDAFEARFTGFKINSTSTGNVTQVCFARGHLGTNFYIYGGNNYSKMLNTTISGGCATPNFVIQGNLSYYFVTGSAGVAATSKPNYTTASVYPYANVPISFISGAQAQNAHTGGTTWNNITTNGYNIVNITIDVTDSVPTNLTITASNAYNGTTITTFNASVTWNGTTTAYTTTTGQINTTVAVNATLPANVTITANQHFTNTTSTTTTSLSGTLIPWTAIKANSYTGTNISNFTATYTNNANPIETGVVNTTNGIAFIPIYNSTYNVAITGAQQGTANYANSEANITGNPYNQSYNFTLYTSNSIRMTIRSESTGAIINGTTITINTNGDFFSTSNTTSNGTFYIDQLPDDEYSIIFSATGYTTRLYTVTVTTASTQELTAYLVNSTSSTTTFNIEAANGPDAGQPVEGAVITFETYVNGSYVLVESRLSDVSGTAGPFSYTTSSPYRVTITKANFVTKQFLLNPVQYTTYDIFLTSTTSFSNAQDYDGISIVFTPSVYYNSAQNNFTFIISSPNGTLTAYNYTITYPTGSVTNSGVNSYGETLTSAFNITGATIQDTVDLAYCYTTALTSQRCFNRPYNIVIAYSNYTLAGTGAASGMGDLEKIGLATVATGILTGAATLGAGPIGAVVVWMVSMGFFYVILDFSIWLLLIPAFVGFLMIAFGSRLQ